MSRPQIPRIDDVIGAGVEALLALRPSVGQKVNVGRYSRIFAGWRAQEALLIQRIADECASARTGFAKGQALLDLLASEFDTVLSTAKTAAIGEVGLSRPAGTRPGGVIRKGHKFRRAGDPTAQPVAKQEALYEAVLDTPLVQGAGSVTVKLRATREGSASNIVLDETGYTTDIVAAEPFFDRTITTGNATMGGGSDGYTEADMLRIATAFASGRYAPTVSAALAGALLGTGIKYAIVRENTTTAVANVIVADQSWGSSDRLAAATGQAINDAFRGFGCRVAVQKVINRFVRAEIAVKLRDPIFSTETTEIDTAIAAAVQSYFNDRPDWDSWNARALRGVISQADPRLLTCTSVTIKDFVSGALPVAEAVESGVHYYLPSSAISTTYALPS